MLDNKTTPRVSKSMRITPRDTEMFYLIFEYQFLTGEQIAHWLDVNWSLDGALAKRLKMMVQVGYLTRPQNAPSKHIYAIGNEGAELLKSEFELIMPRKGNWITKANRLKPSTFSDHEMTLRNYMINLECQHRDNEIVLIRQTDVLAFNTLGTKKGKPFWPVDIYWGEQYHEATVKPDWIFGIENIETGKQVFYFLEIDMGTEPQTRSVYDRNQTILRKVLCYAHSYSLKLAESNFGISNTKTLFLTTGERRMNHMQELYVEYASSLAPANSFLFGTHKKSGQGTSLQNANSRQVSLV